jgi:RimJ/RimL family protein N-acetyltransferase
MADAQVRLRPITEDDLPDYVRWLNDPQVTQWLLRDPGMTLEQEREWFAHISASDYPHVMRAIEVDGRHVGGCGLIVHDAHTANFGIHIGEKSYWGTGCGAAATRDMLRIGFEERGLHRIYLETWTHNTRAIRCYEKCGFRHEGVRRQSHLKGGKWVDAVMMAILREEWEAYSAATGLAATQPGAAVPQDYRRERTSPLPSTGAGIVRGTHRLRDSPLRAPKGLRHAHSGADLGPGAGDGSPPSIGDMRCEQRCLREGH